MLAPVAQSMVISAAGLDADATAIIDELVTAGAAVSAGQQTTINDFVIGAKEDGVWDLATALFFPVWGSAAPNAIDWKDPTGTPGIYQGAGWDYTGGTTKGNGSTDYFETGRVPVAMGMGLDDVALSYYCLEEDSAGGSVDIASKVSNNETFGLFQSSSVLSSHIGTTSGLQAAGSPRNGLLFSNRLSTAIEIVQQDLSGSLVRASDTLADAGAVPSIEFYCHARNDFGSATNETDRSYAHFGFWLGHTPTQRTASMNRVHTLLDDLGLTTMV